MKCKNIIYVVCHDLGRHLGCYGTPINSPNLDAFANNGIKFTNAFCNSPACSPSRACAMTGQYAHTNGMMGLAHRGWSIKSNTIVDYLNEAGFETAHFGFQHENQYAPNNRYQIEDNQCAGDDWYSDRDCEFVEVAIDRAISYLEEHVDSQQPFYLNIGTTEVHTTRWMSDFPKGHLLNRTQDYGMTPLDEVYVPPFFSDTREVREGLAKFEGAISFLDKHVQRLFEAIKRLGYDKNSIIVFTTDHGIEGMRAKSWMYDPGVATALMIQLPENKDSGMTVDNLIQNIDLAPTLLEAVGINVPESMQGISFLNLLYGEEKYTPHKYIFTEKNYHGGTYDPVRTIRTDQFHFIKNFKKDLMRAWRPDEGISFNNIEQGHFSQIWSKCCEKRQEEELYDIKKDPLELNNLVDDVAYQGVLKELKYRLEQWMKDTEDPLLKGDILKEDFNVIT